MTTDEEGSDPLKTRLPVFWCSAPDGDDPDGPSYRSLTFRITGPWFAVDDDQLLLPITVTARDGNEQEPAPGLLKQYGGESMLNDMLVEALDGGQTSRRWQVTHDDERRRILPLEDDAD